MTKPHLNPKCYSKLVTAETHGNVVDFSCSYCHRSWQVPVGITASFEGGRLVAATNEGNIPIPEKRLAEMRENIRWSLEYLSQFVETPTPSATH